MARYKGKREAPHPDPFSFHNREEQLGEERTVDPMEETRIHAPVTTDTGHTDAAENEIHSAGAGDEPTDNSSESALDRVLEENVGPMKKPNFFQRRGGKALIIVVAVLLALALGAFIALKTWMKQPTLPDPSEQGGGTVVQPDDTEEEHIPTDDELYPDDGFDGTEPAVSGDRREGVYTFLLVGTDKGDGNTDTIMVASYDTVNQKIAIMSIPRDTMINEKWDIKKINSVYSRTGNSIEALSNRVKKLVGFRPDFYVKVQLSMFIELVDLIGGVEFDVPCDMDYDDPYQDLHIHLKKGVQLLDGEKAMELVRFRRYSEGDIQRVRVQQDFMKALIKECISLQHWGKIKAYIDLAADNMETDLETASIVWFAANVLGINGAPALSMENVTTCTLPGNYYAETYSRAVKSNQSYVTIYPEQVVSIVNEQFNPYTQRVTAGMLDAMSILPNGDIASSTGTLKDEEHNRIMAVRRGEAYYDENGNFVMGQKPQPPQQDELGNWFVIDSSGVIIYTDENGVPLGGSGGTTEPVLPPEESGTAEPSVPNEGNSQDMPSEEGSSTEPEVDETVPPAWVTNGY